MPYTKQWIKDKTYALAEAGASSAEIEQFVAAASKEMVDYIPPDQSEFVNPSRGKGIVNAELSAAPPPEKYVQPANMWVGNALAPAPKDNPFLRIQQEEQLRSTLPAVAAAAGIQGTNQLMPDERLAYQNEVISGLAKAKGVPEEAIRAAMWGGQTADTAIETILPLGGAVAGSYIAPGPGTMWGGGAGGALANSIVQARRMLRGDQQGFRPGEFVSDVALSAYVPGEFKALQGVSKAVQVPSLVAQRMGEAGTLAAGAETLSQIFDKPIQQQEGIVPDQFDVQRILTVGMLGSLFGAGFSALEAAHPATWAKIKDLTPEQAKPIVDELPITPEVKEAKDLIDSMVGRPAETNLAQQIDQRMGLGPAAESAAVFRQQLGEESARAIDQQMGVREAMQQAGPEGANIQRMVEAQQGATPEVVPDPARVQAEAFAKQAPVEAPEVGPELSAQAQAMQDRYGAAKRGAAFSITEPAIGALGGNLAAEFLDKDEETKKLWTAAGFGMGHLLNVAAQRMLGIGSDRGTFGAVSKKDPMYRSLEQIKEANPPATRFAGKFTKGEPVKRPNGADWHAENLNEPIGPLGFTKEVNDATWQKAINASGDAAARAIKQLEEQGIVMKPPSAEHWAEAEKLPKQDRFWYEISSEAMANSFPDYKSKTGFSQVADVIAATSPLQNPDQNARIAISILSELERGEPVVTPVVNPSSVGDAITGKLGTDNQRKVGSFSETFKFLQGHHDEPPLTTNDRQVAASFNVPDAVFKQYPILYDTVTKYYQGLRDHYNATHAGNFGNDGPMQSWQLQAPSWVQTRAEAKRANRVNITEDEIFAGDAYRSAFRKAADELREVGVDVPSNASGDPIFTKEVLKDPRVTDVLAPSAPDFKDATFLTQEIGTDLTTVGARFNAVVKKSRELGVTNNVAEADKVVKRHLNALSQRTQIPGSNKKTPSILSRLTSVLAGQDIDVSRMELGWGSFMGDFSQNLRAAISVVPEKYREAYIALIGRSLKQAAGAASKFELVLDPAIPPAAGKTRTYSAFLPGKREPDAAVATFAKELSSFGHEVNVSVRPNGLVLDVNPKFGDEGPVGISDKTMGALTRRVFGDDAVISAQDHSSYYVDRSQYSTKIAQAYRELLNDSAQQASEAFGGGPAGLRLAKDFIRGTADVPDSVRTVGARKQVERVRAEYRERLRGFESVQRDLEGVAKNFSRDMREALPTMEKRLGGKELGSIDRMTMARGASFAVGFAAGLAQGKDLPPGQRIAQAIAFGLAGGAVAPAVAKKLAGSILANRQPNISSLLPNAPKARTLKDVYAVFDEATKPQSSLAQKLKTAPGKVITAVQNTAHPLTQVEEAVLGKRPDLPLGDRFSLVAGAAGKAEAGIYALERSRSKLIPDVDDKDINAFLMLRRTFDRLSTDPTNRKVSDYTLPEVQQLLLEQTNTLGPDRMARLEQFAQEVQKSTDADLQLMVSSGRMSQQQYAEIKAANDFYAPFYVMEHQSQTEGAAPMLGGRSYDTTESFTKGITGIHDTEFKLGDMMTALRMNKLRANVLAEKNRAMLQLANLTQSDPNGVFIRELKPRETAPKGWEEVNFMRDGKVMALAVQPEVAAAVKNLAPWQMGWLDVVLSRVATPLRAGATGLSLAFQVVNQLKDQARLATMSKYGMRTLSDLYMYPLDLATGIVSSWGSNVFGVKNQLALDFLNSGAARSTIATTLNPDTFSRAIQRGPASTASKILGIPVRTVIDTTAKMGNAIEETTKMMGLRRGMRFENVGKLTGRARQEAMDRIAYEVRNYAGSPDFAKHGTLGTQFNLIFMFANARMQGAAADLRRLSGGTGKAAAAASAVRLAAGVGIPTYALWAYNNRPENAEDYANRTSVEKNNYFLIPRYNAAGKPMYTMNEQGQRVREYYRWPKGDIVAQTANLVEGALDFAKTKDPKAAVNAGMSMLENLSPVSISGANMSERLDSVISGLNPIIKAPAEMAFNYNTFLHTPIVPDKMKEASPGQQYRRNTPEVFKRMAGAIPEGLPLPSQFRSPLHLQQLTMNLTGNMMTQFLRPEQEGRSPLTSHPILGRFFGSTRLNDEADWERFGKYKTAQTDRYLVRERAIEAAIKDLDNPKLAPRDRIDGFAKIIMADPERNLQAFLNAANDRKVGTTNLDKAVRGLGSRERAMFIEEKTKDMDTRERLEYYRTMEQRKVLDNATALEILKLRKQVPTSK